jgi:hypothetical protein
MTPSTDPQAVGAIPPIPGYVPPPRSDNPGAILASIDDSLRTLAARLAPPSQLIPVQFNNVPAGIAIGTVNIPSGGFNGVLMALTAGTVNLYFGSGATGVPDLQFTGSSNPILIPLPPMPQHQVYIQVDAASPANAVGVLYLIQY